MRKLAQQPAVISEWFTKFEHVLAKLGIHTDDIFNMDECGIRIGIAKNQYVYTTNGGEVFKPHSNNRELVTLVETISAQGYAIEPMIVVKASTIIEKWCGDLPDDYLLNTSDTGYSNDQLCFDYIQHFHKRTANRAKGAWRLLLMDGYASHITYELVKYAYEHQIQLFALPPHTTHFLQPLDVGCFQPLKWHHGQALDINARTGGSDYTKADFLAALEDIRTRTFTPRTIRGGFKRCGIVPLNAEEVLPKLRQQEIAPEAVRPPNLSLRFQEEENRIFTAYASSESSSDSAFEPLSEIAETTIRERRRALREEKLRELYAQARTPSPLPGDEAWATPLTVRTLRKQQQKILLLLPHSARAPAARTFKGALAQAQESAQLKKALLSTKAAEQARASRRRLSQRQVSKGGPIYLKDARRMIKRRQDSEKESFLEAEEKRRMAAHTKIRNHMKYKMRAKIHKVGKAYTEKAELALPWVMKDVSHYQWDYWVTISDTTREDFRRLMRGPSDDEGTDDEVDNLSIQHSDGDSEYT